MSQLPEPKTCRTAFLFLYTLGGCCSVACVALLAWVDFCIAMEKPPLASVAFLSSLPTAAIFIIIIAIMIIGVAAWQWGAKYHQLYEEYMTKQR